MSTPALLSPRQVADALGVSESSVKRWVDQGNLGAERTVGGHRRVPWAEVMRFVRSQERSLERPEVLGLLAGDAVADPSREVREALVEGDGHRLRAAIFHLHAAGATVAEICDHTLATAFADLGERWEHGDLEVYEERRAVGMCEAVLHELSALLAEPEPAAPRAAGGTLAGDWYALPTQMVALALRDRGWHARSLGSSLPMESLATALRQEEVRLFWLSVSWVEDPAALAEAVLRLQALSRDQGTTLVLGGRGLDPESRHRLGEVAICDDLAQMTHIADSLVPDSGPPVAP